MQTQREKRLIVLSAVGIAGILFLYQWFLRPYRKQLEAVNYWLWVLLNHIFSFVFVLVVAVVVAPYFERWLRKRTGKSGE